MPGPLRALLDEHGPFKAQHVTAQPAAFAKRFGEKRRGLDVLPMVRRHAGSDSTAPRSSRSGIQSYINALNEKLCATRRPSSY